MLGSVHGVLRSSRDGVGRGGVLVGAALGLVVSRSLLLELLRRLVVRVGLGGLLRLGLLGILKGGRVEVSTTSPVSRLL